MRQRGVLCPLKFEKACSRKDLRAFMLLYRFMKSGQILPIPNFICTHSPSIFLDFQGVSAFGVLAVTPFLHHFRIWLYWILSDYTILLKLLDGIIQRFGSHMNIPIHCCFDAGVTQQFLQHLRLHTAFNRSCSIGVAQCVHTKVFDPRFVAEFI